MSVDEGHIDILGDGDDVIVINEQNKRSRSPTPILEMENIEEELLSAAEVPDTKTRRVIDFCNDDVDGNDCAAAALCDCGMLDCPACRRDVDVIVIDADADAKAEPVPIA